MSEVDTKRKGAGTKEWAETNFNIGNGCANRCLYCYACANALRFKLKASREEWGAERLTMNASITSYPAKKGTIMFPSSHDITPFYLTSYIKAALLMLQKGNRLLITTKARYDIMDALTVAFKGYEGQILFRVTIGSMSPDLTAFWEPGASEPLERLRALELAQARGFQTSVSSEPMLSGVSAAQRVVGATSPFVTETIWIGKMNKIRLRVDVQDPTMRRQVNLVEQLQQDSEIIRLYQSLKNNPQVRWKDSIREVLAKHGIVPQEVPE